jgi:hypothetical protein
LFVSPIEIPMTFDSRKLYADKIFELMELESLMDRLCYWSFSES